MFVSEIFQSIQGEGALIGVPSIFIRTSGCNLRCTWCDTKYASWHPEGEDVPIEKIVSHVIEQRLHHVVLTGGEPMIARGIRELASRLQMAGRHITIETAGTVLPDGIACDLASLSPKLANSTPPADAVGEEWHGRHERSRCQPGVLAAWIDHCPYQLKFVVQGGDDLREIRELLSQIDREIPPWNVLLMPEGVDLPTTEAHAESVVELCKQFGYRYCHRLHLELFGNTRGT